MAYTYRSLKKKCISLGLDLVEGFKKEQRTCFFEQQLLYLDLKDEAELNKKAIRELKVLEKIIRVISVGNVYDFVKKLPINIIDMRLFFSSKFKLPHNLINSDDEFVKFC